MIESLSIAVHLQQLCDDTRCNPEDLPEAMNDRNTWRKRGPGLSVLAARYDDDDDDDDDDIVILGTI